MTRQRARTLLLLLVLSLLMTPWVHSLIKPYRMRVDISYHHDIPTPIYLYFSNHRKVATDFRDDQVESMFIVPSQETPAPLALIRAIVASKKPVSGLRLDPATTPNDIIIGSLSVHSVTGSFRLSAEQLVPFVQAGSGIADVRLENGMLHFRTTDGDPNFLIPLPPHLKNVPQSEVYLNYLLAWAVAAALVLFGAVMVRKHHIGFTGRFRRPLTLLDGSSARAAWGGLVLDLAAGVLLAHMTLLLVEMYTHFDPSPIFNTLDDDGVGRAVPPEVRDMKTLVRRNGDRAFVLAGDMGKGDDESEIFQRATEYLYPSRIVHQSEWVFGRAEGTLGPEFGDCKVVDKEGGILLYACHH
ncbi:MAG: hypothetical protein JNK17_05760 [Hydrogenophaga sp.]|nr:hypothetical protein [Hydrogenophaga sp.]